MNSKSGAKTEHADSAPSDFTIVGLGASAGGLEALLRFFRAMPAEPGLGFLVVQQPEPPHPGRLPDRLARETRMKVVPAKSGAAVRPNRVHVMPPGAVMRIDGNRRIRLQGRKGRTAPRFTARPVDTLFQSLAAVLREDSVGVIFSGTGRDGVQGLKAVKAHGGLGLAQDPGEARHASMPSGVIQHGLADFVLPASELARVLARHAGIVAGPGGAANGAVRGNGKELEALLRVVRRRTGEDFAPYKRSMIARRLRRRMNLRNLGTLADYRKYLEAHDEEAEAITRDFLIGATGFFRDSGAWEALERRAVAPIVREREDSLPVRVWVPGSATGEEAYSVAMLFCRQMEKQERRLRVQIFASDIDRHALEFARAGRYSAPAVEAMPPELRRRHFIKQGENYQVRTGLRDMVLFAHHNLLRDSPLSRMDLVSCRNLLIYLEPEGQADVFRRFQFSLREGGYLLLGRAESPDKTSEAGFKAISRKWRIYRCAGKNAETPAGLSISAPIRPPALKRRGDGAAEEYRKLACSALLAHLSPASVLVGESFDALYYYGKVQDYLKLPPGEPTHNVLTMVREDLRAMVRSCLHRAARGATPVYEQVRLKGRRSRSVRLGAVPIPPDAALSDTAAAGAVGKKSAGRRRTGTGKPKYYLLTFQEWPGSVRAASPESSDAVQAAVRQMEEELVAARQELQNTIEQLEISNEELKASNEEVMSINEEFQTANEELETSKEELQSLNEELANLNSRLEEKVRELEEKNDDLQNLIASTNIPTIFLTRDFRVKRFTEAATRFLNLIPGDIGRPVSDLTGKLLDPDLLPDAGRVLADLIPAEKELQSRTGQWFLRRILPYRTRDGGVEGVVVTLPEVTELKRYSQELRESEARLKAILDNASSIIFVKDLQGRYTLVNRAFAEFAGRGFGEIIGRTDEEIFPADVAAELMRNDELVRTQGRAFEFEETPAIGPEAGTFLSAKFPLRDLEGGVYAVCGIANDITERKKADLERARLAAIVQSSSDAIFSRDLEGRITSWNAAARAMFGYDESEIVGRHVSLLMPADRRPEAERSLEIARGGGTVYDYETVRLRKDGTEIPVSLTISPVSDPQGRIVAASVIARNISARKRAEKALHDSEEQLRHAQKMEAVGRLAGGIAHDFNNLLTAINGYASLCLELPEVTGTTREAVQEIKNAGERASSLTQQLLAYSRRQILEPKVISLNSVVGEMEKMLNRLMGEEVRLETPLSQDAGWVLADPGRLQQVIVNLAVNARDAMPKGGKLTLATSRASLRAADMAGREGLLRGSAEPGVPAGEYSVLTVSDTGVGMDEQVKARIFEPFFTTKEAGKGTGLGLSTVYGIIKQSGGHLQVFSRPGRGTTFKMFLPIVSQPDEALPESAAGNLKDYCGTEGILLVEDEDNVLKLIRDVLTLCGYRVLATRSGPEALEKLQGFPGEIHLLLTDVVMGEMNGRELAERILELRPGIRVAYMSGYMDDEVIRQGVALEPHRFLPKPFSPLELVRTVRSILNASAGRPAPGI